jgi:hypothetical protein
MTRHALDCGLCCGLAECDCGAELISSTNRPDSGQSNMSNNDAWISLNCWLFVNKPELAAELVFMSRIEMLNRLNEATGLCVLSVESIDDAARKFLRHFLDEAKGG